MYKLVNSPIMDKMTAGLDRKGLKALTVWDIGMKVFSIKGNKPPHRVADDFNGKKTSNSIIEYCYMYDESTGWYTSETTILRNLYVLIAGCRRWSGEYLV